MFVENNSFGDDGPHGSDPLNASQVGSPPACEHDPRFRLDPSRLPKQLDIELQHVLVDQLNAMALQSGRCIEEIVLELIQRSVPSCSD